MKKKKKNRISKKIKGKLIYKFMIYKLKNVNIIIENGWAVMNSFQY